MKFRVNPRFAADFDGLPTGQQKMFRDRMSAFSKGCDDWTTNGPSPHPWPANLRVHQLAGRNRWSMTWHYRRPDGRATFEFFEDDGEVKVRWIRIGGHEIYDEG